MMHAAVTITPFLLMRMAHCSLNVPHAPSQDSTHRHFECQLIVEGQGFVNGFRRTLRASCVIKDFLLQEAKKHGQDASATAIGPGGTDILPVAALNRAEKKRFLHYVSFRFTLIFLGSATSAFGRLISRTPFL
jgi:hypothetical protein